MHLRIELTTRFRPVTRQDNTDISLDWRSELVSKTHPEGRGMSVLTLRTCLTSANCPLSQRVRTPSSLGGFSPMTVPWRQDKQILSGTGFLPTKVSRSTGSQQNKGGYNKTALPAARQSDSTRSSSPASIFFPSRSWQVRPHPQCPQPPLRVSGGSYPNSRNTPWQIAGRYLCRGWERQGLRKARCPNAPTAGTRCKS